MSRHLRRKTVVRLNCRFCDRLVCLRGMKAMLLANNSVQLYSTDTPPLSVQLLEEDYTTSNCGCKLRDIACLECGNVIGYNIVTPCSSCTSSANNGHYFMFHIDAVTAEERVDPASQRQLLWAHLPAADLDMELKKMGDWDYELVCR
ncbi:uncharacterized protein VTP21DRAFT_6322 [Calcarisporiella thermophila]|uniref:uncharacterized protein n=1 Tax=Calcarisporiella thermophila TaxID=911321 RepID=UPI0037425697